MKQNEVRNHYMLVAEVRMLRSLLRLVLADPAWVLNKELVAQIRAALTREEGK